MMIKGILYSVVAALALQPGIAAAKPKPVAAPATVQLPYQSANLPTSAEVRAFYAGWRFAPIWFNGNAVKPAARDLVTILKRAPLDGISTGPQYAAQLEAAINQAAAAPTPQAIAYAEHSLSEALALYAEAMSRPSQHYIYAYDYLKPKPQSADKVLRTAAGAPSLELYLSQVANPNSVYTSIRDAAWRQMQATGSTAADPRVVANLDRARILPAKGRFALVDAATQRLFMYENGVPVDSMKVVVGDPWQLKLPTPMIASMIYYMVHNPYWNVPNHLVRKMSTNLSKASYRQAKGYEIMSDWTTNATPIDPSSVDWNAVREGKLEVRVRQKPNDDDNSMGNLKFPFDNPEGIFLHDTYKKEYFQLAVRAKSNGCVRLEDAQRFARWLLRREPNRPSDGAELFEQLPAGVPIYTTYLTAQVENGQLAFVKDIYGWDPAGGTATQVVAGK